MPPWKTGTRSPVEINEQELMSEELKKQLIAIFVSFIKTAQRNLVEERTK